MERNKNAEASTKRYRRDRERDKRDGAKRRKESRWDRRERERQRVRNEGGTMTKREKLQSEGAIWT